MARADRDAPRETTPDLTQHSDETCLYGGFVCVRVLMSAYVQDIAGRYYLAVSYRTLFEVMRESNTRRQSVSTAIQEASMRCCGIILLHKVCRAHLIDLYISPTGRADVKSWQGVGPDRRFLANSIVTL